MKFIKELRLIFLFLLGGVISYGLNLGIPYVLVEIFGFFYVYAIIITQSVLFVYAFTYNLFLIFRAKFEPSMLLRFLVVLLLNMTGNTLVSILFVEFLGVPYLIAIACSVILFTTIKYMLYQYWVFKTRTLSPRVTNFVRGLIGLRPL
jgi:putative flippase GtrA